jgi:hypothetical protein
MYPETRMGVLTYRHLPPAKEEAPASLPGYIEAGAARPVICGFMRGTRGIAARGGPAHALLEHGDIATRGRVRPLCRAPHLRGLRMPATGTLAVASANRGT